MSDDGSLPKQAAAIAFRCTGGGVQICLIRRKGSNVWGIPKGFVDPGATLEQTALAETREEAGLRGRLRGESIGTYQYDKRGRTYAVAVYLVEILEQEETWLEDGFRERKWMPIHEAASELSASPVRPVLDRAVRQLERWPETSEA